MRQKKRWPLMTVALFTPSVAMVFFIRSTFDSCSVSPSPGASATHFKREAESTYAQFNQNAESRKPNPIDFMRSKLVLFVSHELSLSGGPSLLMELAFLLRGVGAEVVWNANQKPAEADEVIYSLDHKMLDREVQVFSAKSRNAIDTALKADLVILNTAVAGKWLEAVLKENVLQVLPKVLWWIHEKSPGQLSYLAKFFANCTLCNRNSVNTKDELRHF